MAVYFLVLVIGTGYFGIAWSILIGWMAALLEVGIRYFAGRWKNKAIAAVVDMPEHEV